MWRTTVGEKLCEEVGDGPKTCSALKPGNLRLKKREHIVGAGIAHKIPQALVELGICVGCEDRLRICKELGQIRHAGLSGWLGGIGVRSPIPFGLAHGMVKDVPHPLRKSGDNVRLRHAITHYLVTAHPECPCRVGSRTILPGHHLDTLNCESVALGRATLN